jgi:hypothetical protein
MLDMQWVRQRFESTRKAAANDGDAHQLTRPDPRPVYRRLEIDDLPSIAAETECVTV